MERLPRSKPLVLWRPWLTSISFIRLGWYFVGIAIWMVAWSASKSPYHTSEYAYVSGHFAPWYFRFWLGGMFITLVDQFRQESWIGGILHLVAQLVVFFVAFATIASCLTIYSSK